jgi:hypothetical protein
MMLEMEHVKPIVDDPDPQRKRILLKRDVSLKAIGCGLSVIFFCSWFIDSTELQPDVVRQILSSEESAKLVLHALQITADNLGYGNNGLVSAAVLTHADDMLKTLLPDDIEIPTSFEIIGPLMACDENLLNISIGHIAHLNLRPPQIPYQHLIGQAILKKVSALRTVINKTSNIESEFRTLPLQVIAGDNDLETAVVRISFADQFCASMLWHS